MSSIYQKRGYYYYQRYWKNPETGNRERVAKSLRTKDVDEAENLKQKWDEYYDKKETNPDYERHTIKGTIVDYKEHRETLVSRGELSEETLKSDKLALNHFKDWIDENHTEDDITLDEVNTEHVRDFKEWRSKSVKVNTVGNNLRHLQSFFSFLYQRQLIDIHPFDNINIPQTQRRMFIPSESEWNMIVNTLEIEVAKENPDPFFVALYLQSRTGMRIGEVVRLKWERGGEDFGEGHSGKYSYIDGREAVIYFKKRLRRIPLNHVWHAIEKLERSDNSPYLFESPNRGIHKHVRRDSWSRRTSKWFSVDMELSDKYTNHVIRHGFVTEMMRKGQSMAKVAEMVGHSHTRITEIYTHVTTSDLETMFE